MSKGSYQYSKKLFRPPVFQYIDGEIDSTDRLQEFINRVHNMTNYIAVISKYSTDYGVIYPDFDGLTVIRNTIDECLNDAQEELQICVNAMKTNNEPLPEPTIKLDESVTDRDCIVWFTVSVS